MIGKRGQRPRSERAEDDDRAEVRKIRHPCPKGVGDRGKLQDQDRAVPPGEDDGETRPHEGPDLAGIEARHQTSRNLRRSSGPRPRKPQVAPTWAIETPRSEGGPGRNQNARPSGTPSSKVARVSGQAQPSRW